MFGGLLATGSTDLLQLPAFGNLLSQEGMARAISTWDKSLSYVELWRSKAPSWARGVLSAPSRSLLVERARNDKWRMDLSQASDSVVIMITG